MSTTKSFLELKVIYKDDEIKLNVHASNGGITATAQVYDMKEALLKLAESLKQYPLQVPLLHRVGVKNGYGYFSITFFHPDPNKHIAVQLVMENTLFLQHSITQIDKAQFSFITDYPSIERFAQELEHLAKDQEGKALLTGTD